MFVQPIDYFLAARFVLAGVSTACVALEQGIGSTIHCVAGDAIEVES